LQSHNYDKIELNTIISTSIFFYYGYRPRVLKWQGIYALWKNSIATYSIKRQKLIPELRMESDAFQMRLCRGPRDTSFKTQYPLPREPLRSG